MQVTKRGFLLTKWCCCCFCHCRRRCSCLVTQPGNSPNRSYPSQRTAARRTNMTQQATRSLFFAYLPYVSREYGKRVSTTVKLVVCNPKTVVAFIKSDGLHVRPRTQEQKVRVRIRNILPIVTHSRITNVRIALTGQTRETRRSSDGSTVHSYMVV